MSVGAGVVEVVKLNVTTEDMKTILYLKKLSRSIVSPKHKTIKLFYAPAKRRSDIHCHHFLSCLSVLTSFRQSCCHFSGYTYKM